MARQLGESGLLPVITESAKEFARQLHRVKAAELQQTQLQLLTSQISAQMRQQQQQQQVRATPAVPAADRGPRVELNPMEPRVVGFSAEGQLLGYICIRTFNALVQCWPGKLLVGARFAPCVVPVAELAWEVLGTRFLPKTPVDLLDLDSSSSSGQSSSDSGSGAFSFDVFAAAAQLPGFLAQRLAADLAPDTPGGRAYEYTDSTARANFTAKALFDMLALNLALHAVRLHHAQPVLLEPEQQQQQGFMLQQQQPEPHHDMLVTHLEMPWLGWQQQQSFTAPPAVTGILIAITAMQQHLLQPQQQHLAFVEVLSQWVRYRQTYVLISAGSYASWDVAVGSLPVLLQCDVLQGAGYSPADRRQQLLQSMQTQFRLLEQVKRAAEQRTARMSLDMATAMSGADALQAVVLLELAPAVQQCLADLGSAAAGAGSSNTLQMLLQLSDLITAVDGARLMAEAELDEGCIARVLQAYEWLIHALMQQQDTAAARGQMGRLHGTAACLANIALSTLKEVGFPIDSSASRAAFSAVTTCLKACDSISASGTCSSSSSSSSSSTTRSVRLSDRMQNLQVCYQCLMNAVEWLPDASLKANQQQQQQQRDEQPPQDGQPPSAASANDHRQQLLLLCAHTLAVYGRILEQLVITARSTQGTQPFGSAAGASPSGTELLLDTVKAAHINQVSACVEMAGVALEDVQLPGEPAAAAEARQQLQTQQGQLRLSLQDLERNIPALQALEAAAGFGVGHTSSSRLRSSRPAAAAVQRQLDSIAVFATLPPLLQQFGDAVCSQLPLAYWCCNPACVQLQGVSELEPVAGKGCVCAKCKTARFCCSACIAQCYQDQHKQVCKRIARHAAAKQMLRLSDAAR